MIEGQDGSDTMLFNGSAANERMEASANGGRVLFTRDVAAIVMDLNDVEKIVAKALAGADTVTVNDLSGTDVTSVNPDLAAAGGGDDARGRQRHRQRDERRRRRDGHRLRDQRLRCSDWPPRVAVSGAGAGSDRVTVNALAGDDVVDASSLAAGVFLTANGGDGDDILIGGNGADTLLGGAATTC